MSSSGSPLPTRTRLLVLISALYALKRRARAFDLVRESLEEQIIPRLFFSELFIHLSLFLGYPAMLDGLERLHSLKANMRPRRPISLRCTASRTTGMATLRKVYGEQATKLLEHLDELHPGLRRRTTEDAYGTVIVSPGLRLAERELVNVVVLFIEGYHRQFYSHLRGALRVGVSPLILKAALRCAGSAARKDGRMAIATVDNIVRSQPVRSL